METCRADSVHNSVYRRRISVLWVTDPGFEREYLQKPDGDYEIDECFLTISLGEPYGGKCYKLIAAIMPRDR